MAITKVSIQNKIRNIENSIAKKYEEIDNLNIELDELNDKLQAIEEYESTPVEERTLCKYVYEDTGSVALMDEFESITEEGYRRYERLYIKNARYISGYRCHFVIERMKGNDYCGDITMTNFKKGYISSLITYVASELEKYSKGNKIESKQLIRFSNPYLLRAQNSSNRTGYGSEYNGYDLVYQGTLYGETTKYAFVGVIVE